MKWWLLTALVAAVAAGAALASCDESSGTEPYCGDGVVDPGEQCDDGNKWNNDGCSSVCTLEIAHPTLVVNVGLNRDVVPGYAGDSIQSFAKLLVIDGTGPDGHQLEHQEIDTKFGQFGWTYTDVPLGHYVITMQLFTEDASGNLVALTAPRDGEGDVTAVNLADNPAMIWVDYSFRDFSVSYTGNLKWQYNWGPGDAGDSGVADGGIPDAGTLTGGVNCAQATPPVSKVRITLRNEQAQVVSAQTSLNTPTNGSQRVDCHDFGASDAEVVTSIPWGIYEMTLEGLDSGNSVTYCARRALFNTKGDGVIFKLTGQPGACE